MEEQLKNSRAGCPINVSAAIFHWLKGTVSQALQALNNRLVQFSMTLLETSCCDRSRTEFFYTLVFFYILVFQMKFFAEFSLNLC